MFNQVVIHNTWCPPKNRYCNVNTIAINVIVSRGTCHVKGGFPMHVEYLSVKIMAKILVISTRLLSELQNLCNLKRYARHKLHS